jgi:Domain of unknown function (DUF4157)
MLESMHTTQKIVRQDPLSQPRLEIGFQHAPSPDLASNSVSIAQRSAQVQQLTQLQAIANGGAAAPLQRKSNDTGLPDQLRSGIESLSGVSMEGVKVHYNSAKPATLQAHAYAQGRDIHIAPGQERHLPHEAWHVVQQAQGRVRPTLQLKGVAINDDSGLEREADVMGVRAMGGAVTMQRQIQNLHFSNSILPVQRVTVQEHVVAGKKVVMAGEIHGEIDVKKETTFWANHNPAAKVTYENEMLTLDEKGGIQMPPDHHYALIILNLEMLIDILKVLADQGNITDEADEFLENEIYQRPVDKINAVLNAVGVMAQVKQKGFDAPYTKKQLELAKVAINPVGEIIELVEAIANAQKGKAELLAHIVKLQALKAMMLKETGAPADTNLHVLRSHRMVDIVDAYAKRVQRPVIYKVGENHIDDMKAIPKLEGTDWVAVGRVKYLADTKLDA